MSVRTEMFVDGLAELEKALQDLPAELVGKNGGPIRTALMNAGLPMWRQMQATVASQLTDEGELLKTIKRKRVKNPKGMSEAIEVGAVGARNVPDTRTDENGNTVKRDFLNPIWLEMGTKQGIDATPFVRPAFDANREASVANFRRTLAGAIERIAKKVGNENAAKVGARIKKL